MVGTQQGQDAVLNKESSRDWASRACYCPSL